MKTLKDSSTVDDRDARIKRMEAYLQSTHQSFLSSLKRAEQLKISDHGVLVGPVAKRIKVGD